jgi:hypothetical protein
MITGQADTVVVLAVVEGVVASPEVEDQVLVGAETEVTDKCSMPLVVTAESRARYLSGLQTVNRSIVATVLRKWEMAAGKREGLMTGLVHPRNKVDLI